MLFKSILLKSAQTITVSEIFKLLSLTQKDSPKVSLIGNMVSPNVHHTHVYSIAKDYLTDTPPHTHTPH